MNRRSLLATAIVAVANAVERRMRAGSHAHDHFAQGPTENVARRPRAGNRPGGGIIAGEWAKRKGVKLNWITANIEPMHDRAFPRAVAARDADRRCFRHQQVLDPEDQLAARSRSTRGSPRRRSMHSDGIPSNLLVAVKYDGKLTAILFRHATTGLHYNETLFKERGLSGAAEDGRRTRSD